MSAISYVPVLQRATPKSFIILYKNVVIGRVERIAENVWRARLYDPYDGEFMRQNAFEAFMVAMQSINDGKMRLDLVEHIEQVEGPVAVSRISVPPLFERILVPPRRKEMSHERKS